MSALLLDTLISTQNLKNDAALSRFLDISPCQISDIRNGRPKTKVGPKLIIKIHEKTDMSVKQIKALAAA